MVTPKASQDMVELIDWIVIDGKAFDGNISGPASKELHRAHGALKQDRIFIIKHFK